MVGRGADGVHSAPPAPPWWEEPVRPEPVGPSPPLPWSPGPGDGHSVRDPAVRPRPAGRWRRPAVLIVIGVLVGVVAVGGLVAAAVRTPGGTGTVTTPFLSYATPPGWNVAPPDPAPGTDTSTLVGVVHGPRYTCAGEEFVRGFAASALLPTDAAAGPADRAERVVQWFAATTYSASDGTPPDVRIASPRTVQVAGPEGPVDGTVIEATVRAPGAPGDCTATAGRVLVLAVPADGGAALLLVAGDTGGGPADPAPPHPSTLDAVVDSARMT